MWLLIIKLRALCLPISKSTSAICGEPPAPLFTQLSSVQTSSFDKNPTSASSLVAHHGSRNSSALQRHAERVAENAQHLRHSIKKQHFAWKRVVPVGSIPRPHERISGFNWMCGSFSFAGKFVRRPIFSNNCTELYQAADMVANPDPCAAQFCKL